MRLLLGLLWLLHWLPLPLLGRLGEAIGALLFVLVRSRRHIALTNLRLCLPELAEAERQAIARQHFKDYARAVLERGILWWAPPARLKRLIKIEPAVPLELIGAGPTDFPVPAFRLSGCRSHRAGASRPRLLDLHPPEESRIRPRLAARAHALPSDQGV